jgi:dual specificity phosphatase 12
MGDSSHKKKVVIIKKKPLENTDVKSAQNQNIKTSSNQQDMNFGDTSLNELCAQEIYPGLWLGDINAALDKKFLHNKKITCIFNCTKSLPFIDDPYITSKYRVAVMDNLEDEEIYKMYKLINPTINKLFTMLNDNNVLVHCHKGKQRSATIIIAYLMKFAHMTKKEALYCIRTKRPVICTPSTNFDKALDKYEHDLRK